MKAAFVGVAVLSVAICRAGSADDVILAAMRVSEVPNYSWISAISDDVQDYVVEGKTTAEGYTWVRLPVMPAIACRLGRDAESHLEAIFKDAAACVIRTADGWTPLEALPERHEDWIDQPPIPPGSVGLLGGYSSRPGGPVSVTPRANVREVQAVLAFDPADLAVFHPHEELAILVSSGADWQVESGTARGALNEMGAQLLLMRGRQENLKILSAGGVFKLWIKDGFVVRYAIELEAVLKMGRKKIAVHQTSRTSLKDIGVTALNVPDEARLKLQW